MKRAKEADPQELRICLLTAELWPDLVKLFGERGACGGCWCMSWRIEKGERWEEVKGPTAKRRLRQLVRSGKAKGCIAFDGDEPVAWCTFGPRLEFPRLQRARTLACDDAAAVWSIPCFFVRRDHRNAGVAGRLLDHVLSYLEEIGVETVEGYPVKTRGPKPLPAAFVWTGVPGLFRAAGFEVVGNPDGAKLRMRKSLQSKSR